MMMGTQWRCTISLMLELDDADEDCPPGDRRDFNLCMNCV